MQELKTKDQVLACYQAYIDTLSIAIQDIQTISAKNQKFERIQDRCVGEISNLLNESRAQMEQVMAETVWDKLVIAFFGETNAGKSTIIETFRVMFNDESRLSAIRKNGGKGVDGLIVGDGRQDFTQVYEKYNLEIDGSPFVLIDVPGIEGKESDYLKEIRSALKQAHCVLYVQGHNKKPDAATAEKIKGFLSDWVDVYSIYNVRGGVCDYDEVEERLTLITPRVKEVQESIKRVFEEILDTVYKGNVTCQGYLALLSVANIHESRQKLIEDQKKLENIFGDQRKIEIFSGFSAITDLVRSQATNFSTHILEANVQKLRSLSNRILNGVNETIMSQKDGLDKLVDQLRHFKNTIGEIRIDEITKLRSRLYSEQSQMFWALNAAAIDIIDSGSNEKEWKIRLTSRFDTIMSLFTDTLKTEYSKTVSVYQQRITAKRKDLDEIIYQEINIPEPRIRIDIDLSDILKALQFNVIDDLLKALIKSVLNPIGTLIRVFKHSEDGRDKSKRLFREMLENKQSYVRDCLDNETAKIQEALKNQERIIGKAVSEEIDNINSLKMDLENLRLVFKQNN